MVAGVDVRDLFDLGGRVAIVTGGATGIGLQMADALAELGASVVLCGRDGERCERVAAKLEQKRGVSCAGVRCDVSSADESRRWSRRRPTASGASTCS